MPAEILNITNDAYFSDAPASVSHSELDVFRASPSLYHGRYVAKLWPQESSVAFDVGTAFHSIILDVGEKFIPIPPEVLSARGAREGQKWKDWANDHQGVIALKEAEFAPLDAMAASVKAHPFARRLIYDWPGKNEVKIRWTDETTGIVRRAMLDAPRLPGECEHPIIADLKTMARMPTAEMFSKVAWQFGYARQCEWYKDAVEALTGDRLPFVFICVLKQPPYTCRVFELDEEYVRIAQDENRTDLLKFKARREADDWSDDEGSVFTVPPPNWARYTPDWSLPT